MAHNLPASSRGDLFIRVEQRLLAMRRVMSSWYLFPCKFGFIIFNRWRGSDKAVYRSVPERSTHLVRRGCCVIIFFTDDKVTRSLTNPILCCLQTIYTNLAFVFQ